MLGSLDSRVERRAIIVREDRNGSLSKDPARIHSFIDEMNGAAGDFYARFERITDAVRATKRGEEGRVDIDHTPAEAVDEALADNAHEARQDDEVGGALRDEIGERGAIGFTIDALFKGERLGLDPSGARDVESSRIRPIAYDEGDLRIAPPCVDRFGDGPEVGALSRDEDD